MAFVIIANLPVKETSIAEVRSKLAEYAAKYRSDVGTLSWNVHQDATTPSKFTIIERYENEGSLKAHTANAAYPTFFPWVKPHLAGKPEILKYNEIPVSSGLLSGDANAPGANWE
ncbi:hypothetical protein RQP46_010698 [Phenoliferia psychrophenolica]